MIRFYNAICALGLVMMGFGAKAQQIIWSENFSYSPGPGFPAGWLSNGWGCDYDVYIQTNCAPRTGNNTRLAGVSGYQAVSRQVCGFAWSHQTDLLLQTPFLDLRGKQHPRLKFDSYFVRQKKNGHFERAAIQVTTDSGRTWNVLREAPPARIAEFNTCLVDLSAYTTAPGAIRIGFFYTDSAEYMPGWLMDNFEVRESSGADLALVTSSESDTFRNYHVAPATVNLVGCVVNYGAAPVTGFIAYWQDGNGSTQSTTITGVNIAPLDSFRFTHTVPLGLSGAERHPIKMWITMPGDGNPTNDQLRINVNGSLFEPRKRVVIEEGTGTWNIGAPLGDVYLHALDTMTNPPIRISSHAEDVLEYKAYADYLYALDQLFTPYFMFDRRGGVHRDAFFRQVAEDQSRFGFADIDMRMTYNAGVLSVDVDIQPAADMPGNYRVALVLTENNVRGTTAAYDQANGYSSSHQGATGTMGGYESKPDPVPAADMRYDYVARVASPGPEGRLSAVPANPKAGQHYTSSFVQNVGISWKKPDLNAIVLLIRESDSTIVNAAIRKFSSLAVAGPAQLVPDARLQPNPARDATQLYLDLPRSGQVQVSIVDISGRFISMPVQQVLQPGEHRWNLPTSHLAPGMYLVRIAGPGFQQSLKLSVVQ
jgi:hypothetical protein